MATPGDCGCSVGYHNRAITLESVSVGITERGKQSETPRENNIVKEKEEFLSKRKEWHNQCQFWDTVRAVVNKS